MNLQTLNYMISLKAQIEILTAGFGGASGV